MKPFSPSFTWLRFSPIALTLSFLILTACQSQPALQQGQIATTSGFGGTGKTGDSGFGGTGIIGTITKFGSIWVNGIEVSFSKDVQIHSNLAVQDTLKIGQQVMVETTLNKAQPWVSHIYIHYPIAGQINHVDSEQITVDGHIVVLTKESGFTLKDTPLKVGDMIAINGYLNPNNTWTATLITQNPAKLHLYEPNAKFDFSRHIKKLVIETTQAQLPRLSKVTDQNTLNEINAQMEGKTRFIITADIKDNRVIHYDLQEYNTVTHDLHQQTQGIYGLKNMPHATQEHYMHIINFQEQCEQIRTFHDQSSHLKEIHDQRDYFDNNNQLNHNYPKN